MWLLFAWIIAEPTIQHERDQGVIHSLVELQGGISQLGTAIALSVAAYLVGAVSQALSTPLIKVWRGLRPFERELKEDSNRFEYEVRANDRYVSTRANIVRERNAQGRMLTEDEKSSIQRWFDNSSERAVNQAMAELELPATLLVGKSPEIFAEVDRLRAEGELRVTVVPPLIALAVLLAQVGSKFWYLGVLGAVVLAWQGSARINDSRDIIQNAIQLGHAESPAMLRFDSALGRVQNRYVDPNPEVWNSFEEPHFRELI